MSGNKHFPFAFFFLFQIWPDRTSSCTWSYHKLLTHLPFTRTCGAHHLWCSSPVVLITCGAHHLWCSSPVVLIVFCVVALFVFVLCFMPNIASVSGLSILDCAFGFLWTLFFKLRYWNHKRKDTHIFYKY